MDVRETNGLALEYEKDDGSREVRTRLVDDRTQRPTSDSIQYSEGLYVAMSVCLSVSKEF